MKNLTNFIQEKYLIDNDTQTYTCQPKGKFELRKILEERLEKDKNADLNDIDVSQITDMSELYGDTGLFEDLDPHNIDISNWDVSKVEKMTFMFNGCTNFNSDLSKWNVSKVTDMYSMFYNCKNFNCDLSNWDVSKVINMKWMFYTCKKFTGEGLENWNVSNVKGMDYMFGYCNSLKNKPSWYKE